VARGAISAAAAHGIAVALAAVALGLAALIGWQVAALVGAYLALNAAYSLGLKHVAVVDVNYSVKSYSIQYKDSTELGYDGGNIHPNYNGWIQNLDKGIRAQLSTL